MLFYCWNPGERRTYPEERMPLPAPSLGHQPPPAPRVEKKPESKNVDDILKPPGRESRPERVSAMHLTSNCCEYKDGKGAAYLST